MEPEKPQDKSGDESEIVFDINNLWYSPFDDVPEEESLFRGLSFTVRKGESIAILGPSGEGKSTLLKVMAGLLRPAKGNVNVYGVNLYDAPKKQREIVRRRVGMTFQRGGLFDSMTCAENLRLPLRESWRLSKKVLDQKVDKALKEVRLFDVEDLMVHEISGGMQKRLGVARALVLSPEVVLFDEPTAGLDPVTSRAIVELILEVRKRYKMTLVTVTSDVARAYQVADRLTFLYQGKLLNVDENDLFHKSKNPMVYNFLRGITDGE